MSKPSTEQQMRAHELLKGERRDLLLIWENGVGPLIGVKSEDGYYVLCGSPYGDGIVIESDVRAAIPLPTPDVVEALREDAERWRAFASSRFKFAGSAGFDHSAYPIVTVAEPDALHLGLEIWPSDGSDAENEQYVHGRNLLMAYVEQRRGAPNHKDSTNG